LVKRVDGIRAVTYDCWGTLLKDRDWEGAWKKRLGALCDSLGIEEAEADQLLKEAWAKHDEAWKQVESFGAGRMAAYCLEARGVFDDDRITELTRKFEEASVEVGVEAVEGAEETLAALEQANIKIGLVCDTGLSPGRVVRQMLEDCGLAKYIEVMCFSDEVGVPKPANEIFEKALAGLGVLHPPEAIHVGDLKRTDIAGAHDIGMHTARFRGVHDDKSDVVDSPIILDTHQQLLEAIGLR
jgi:putative hydrolase of the HAD superfamily